MNRNFLKTDILWANKDIKRYSTSLIIRETQTKCTMRCHLTPVRTLITEKTRENKYQWGCGGKGTLVQCWWECKLVQPLWKDSMGMPQKLKKELSHDPAIPLLGTSPKETKTGFWRDYLHSQVHCSIMRSRQDMEKPTVFTERMDKGVVYRCVHTLTLTKEYHAALRKDIGGLR